MSYKVANNCSDTDDNSDKQHHGLQMRKGRERVPLSWHIFLFHFPVVLIEHSALEPG